MSSSPTTPAPAQLPGRPDLLRHDFAEALVDGRALELWLSVPSAGCITDKLPTRRAPPVRSRPSEADLLVDRFPVAPHLAHPGPLHDALGREVGERGVGSGQAGAVVRGESQQGSQCLGRHAAMERRRWNEAQFRAGLTPGYRGRPRVSGHPRAALPYEGRAQPLATAYMCMEEDATGHVTVSPSMVPFDSVTAHGKRMTSSPVTTPIPPSSVQSRVAMVPDTEYE